MRPILLSVSQSDVLESLQKRAMNVIFPGYDYKMALINAGVDTLCSRREELTQRFFIRHVLNETSRLHYLLPPKRDENITTKLRRSRLFENSKTNTNRFLNTFIPYCIKNFQ